MRFVFDYLSFMISHELMTDKKPAFNNLAKYSGMVFQMGVIIALGVWAGIKLDEKFPIAKFPVFTMTLSLFSVFASMYWVIKDLMKK